MARGSEAALLGRLRLANGLRFFFAVKKQRKYTPRQFTFYIWTNVPKVGSLFRDYEECAASVPKTAPYIAGAKEFYEKRFDEPE